MTLTTRLSVFFQSMLAVVLIGFSAALYLLADNYLHRRIEERLDTVLNTISGAIEAGPEGVEWEPTDRQQNLDFSAFEDQVAWVVTDRPDHVVACSQGGMADQFLTHIVPALGFKRSERSRRQTLGSWKVGQRWIPAGRQPSDPHESSPPEEGTLYRALSVTAGVSVLPMRATLRHLASTLAGLSAVIWIIAFVAGRQVCRRALLPVQQMAVAAGQITADDFAQRLPPLNSNDELEELSRAFNRMLDRLQEAYERQRRFTGDASHQLRTPLTAILGQVDVALRRERSVAEYRQVLETVRQRTTHLTRMVESLLFLARAAAETSVPAMEPLELTHWLPQHLQTWSEHLRFDDISFENNGPEPCVIMAQPALLGELLNILLDNACKYSEPGTPITLRVELSGQLVRVDVEDQGCGLEEAEMTSLFEPFCRSCESRRRGIDGVGLGLSIAKRLSEVFGGELTVKSQPTRGSCFTLTFPKAESTPTADAQHHL